MLFVAFSDMRSKRISPGIVLSRVGLFDGVKSYKPIGRNAGESRESGRDLLRLAPGGEKISERELSRPLRKGGLTGSNWV